MESREVFFEVKFIGKRLRKWRKTAFVNARELSSVIELSQSALSEIENNKSLPSAGTLAKLCSKTNINIVWLLTNRGPMTAKKFPVADENFQDNGLFPFGYDNKLLGYLRKFVRVYYFADLEKKSHLLGFITGADPGKR